MPGIEFWAALLDASAPVALAAFAIWVLQREFKRQLQERDERLASERKQHEERMAMEQLQRRAEHENYHEERQELVGVIERNTTAWHETTSTLGQIAAGMAILCTSLEESRRDVGAIRTMLATRPCIGDAAVED